MAVPLVGTAWHLVAYRDAAGNAARVDADVPATASFGRDHTVTGRSGCNYYSAHLATRGSAMAVDSLQVSAMLCMQRAGATRGVDLMTLERAFLDDLQQVRGSRIAGSRLELTGATGTPLLIFSGTPPVVRLH
jgi:heat shock protein HslJ